MTSSAKIGEIKIVKTAIRSGRGCPQGHHVNGVCAHPGSKPSAAKAKLAARKAGKAARRARRIASGDRSSRRRSRRARRANR